MSIDRIYIYRRITDQTIFYLVRYNLNINNSSFELKNWNILNKIFEKKIENYAMILYLFISYNFNTCHYNIYMLLL